MNKQPVQGERVLHLTLKKKWFDMIASGEKKEEYREVKPHWVGRIAKAYPGQIGGDFMDKHIVVAYKFKEFDKIKFAHGYGLHRPFFYTECNGIDIGAGKPEWGAEPGTAYFIIKLGKIIQP
jgi:hypothetical protein